jgi:mono/diheme cytochrome c family protein
MDSVEKGQGKGTLALMSPRQIFTPLSGSVRSTQAKSIRQAQGLAAEYEKRAASLRQEIDTKLRKAQALECEAWSARMWSGGPAQPSPTLADALDSGFVILKVQCGSCHRLDEFDLRKLRRKLTTRL